MSTRGYSISPSPLGHTSPNPFSTAISSLRSTYQAEIASEDALQYIDTVLKNKSTSPTPSQVSHGSHEDNNDNNNKQQDTQIGITTISRPRLHSVTPKASPIVSPLAPHRSSSTGSNGKDTGLISRMRSAAFDISQNIAQPILSHPPPAFLSPNYIDSNIDVTGTLLSLPALMDKPISSNFPSSTDPTFVLQNIYATNVNELLHTKGYIPSIQVKDMGKALASHIRTCTGSGFESPQEEKLIQTDLLARLITYAAIDLNVEIADYMVASHGSTIPLIIYWEVQEDWDYTGNSDNFLLMDTTKTIQDDLDEAFSNRQHKNIMAITTPAALFTQQDKNTITDAVANETPLPDKWAFTDEKGHKRPTFAWLSGQPSPKQQIKPTLSFSPSIGQKHPLETDQDTNEDVLTYSEKLQAIQFRLPLPQSTIDTNLDMWTETINKYMENCRLNNTDINPTTLRAITVQTAEKLMKQEYFVNKVRKVARSKDSKALLDFADEWYRSLQNEIDLQAQTHPQDAHMQDIVSEPSKTECIRRTTAIWRNTAKTLWRENILTCNQETLDQATRLLLLADSSHKYALLSEADIYNTELDRRDCIIAKITELNENVEKAIRDIKNKSTRSVSASKGKLKLIKNQGWQMAKRKVTKNPDKFAPPGIPPTAYPKIVSDIVTDLKDKEDDTWEIKILKDVKNKGLQAKALEARTQVIIRRLHSLQNNEATHITTSAPTSQPPSRASPVNDIEPTDQEMDQADPIPWTDTEDYKQNRQLWINTASEIYEKISPYLQLPERKQKEDLLVEVADICTLQDKDFLQLQSISSFTDGNKKRELENMQKFLIDKEYKSLVKATEKQEATNQKEVFEDYLTSKDFAYYVQHAKDQLSNPAVPQEKKNTLKTIIKDAEKWQPKHQVDNDGSILPDSPPPSPSPKKKDNTRKRSSKTMAEMTRKGNTPNTRHLQKLLNEMNADNGQKIM
ncbi:hypothetical protein AMATHDRAFT_7261 [Amanita thiersii Skay4041]|uniref:Uncharacterized protein n=1 Tax=Amanita thiersii Skay4041 TaxID=703135 RepID=A0A2A9NF86_9AGAR|nr:hypothetical protein AMATHDRAFT_7261 [Amanita thiersii Skay4041]